MAKLSADERDCLRSLAYMERLQAGVRNNDFVAMEEVRSFLCEAITRSDGPHLMWFLKGMQRLFELPLAEKQSEGSS